MGRKIGKVALTESDVLYVSEDPDPKDVERYEKKASTKEGEKELNGRLTTMGWKH